MSDATPEWDLARTEPIRFFGLEAGCNRVDLRRRYSAMIRRYKPESFPDEFMVIRAAFEAADAMLLTDAAPSKPAAFALQVRESSKASSSQQPSSQSERRQSGSHVHGRSTSSLRHSILEEARRISSDEFYRVTLEDLVEFIRRTDFDEWGLVLETVSKFADDDEYRNPPVGKIQFLLHVLPFAIWKSPSEWIQSQTDFLNSNADLVEDEGRHQLLLDVLQYRSILPAEDYEELHAAFMPLHQHIVRFLSLPLRQACIEIVKVEAELERPGALFDQILAQRTQYALSFQLELWEKLLSIADYVLNRERQGETRRETDEWVKMLVENGLKPAWDSKGFRTVRNSAFRRKFLIDSFRLAFVTTLGWIVALVIDSISLPLPETSAFGAAASPGKRLIAVACGVFVTLKVYLSTRRSRLIDSAYMLSALEAHPVDLRSIYEKYIRTAVREILKVHAVTWTDLQSVLIERSDVVAMDVGCSPEFLPAFARMLSSDPIIRCSVAGAAIRRSR